MIVLLATCASIWLAMPQGTLSPLASQIINDPANKLVLRDVSIWEVTLKHSAGKLALPDAPRVWVPQQTKYFQIQKLSLEEHAIYQSGELPRIHPRSV